MDEDTSDAARIVGHKALADRMGWESPNVSRSLSSKANRRRQTGTSRPGDLPPPDGYEIAGRPRRRTPYWLESTIAEWDAARPRTVQRNRNLPNGLKACSKCGESKPISEFDSYTDKRRPGLGRRPTARCRSCRVAHALAWNTANPGRSKAQKAAYKKRNHRRIKARSYGLAEHELAALEAATQGHCAICGEFAGDGLHIDHCHEKGHVRGLLCNLCNVGLGAFRDDPRRLARAIIYLKAGQRGVFDEPAGAGTG